MYLRKLATRANNYLLPRFAKRHLEARFSRNVYACEAESPEHQLFWARPRPAQLDVCLGSSRHGLWQRLGHATVARLRVHVCSLTLPSPADLGDNLRYRRHFVV